MIALGEGEQKHTGAMFTNVAVKLERNAETGRLEVVDHWWEGLTPQPPWEQVEQEAVLIEAGTIDPEEGWHDWTRQPLRERSLEQRGNDWAQRNSRGTTRLSNLPNWIYTARELPKDQQPDGWDHPDGIPVNLVLWGGRRSDTEALFRLLPDSASGIVDGFFMGAETTAAEEGVTKKPFADDSFAQRPFFSIPETDHLRMWLKIVAQLGDQAPRFGHYNAFRRGPAREWLFHGYSDAAYLVAWYDAYQDGQVRGIDTPLGLLPTVEELLDLPGITERNSPEHLAAALAIHPAEWEAELARRQAYAENVGKFGEGLPPVVSSELQRLADSLVLQRVEAVRAERPVRPLMAGNWKANTVEDLDTYLWRVGQSVPEGVDVTLFVPDALLSRVADTIEHLPDPGLLRVGAQDISIFPKPGALTGESVGQVLKDGGAREILVGHSERRTVVDASSGRRIRVEGQGETHATIVQKIKNARALGLPVVLCLGETFDERQAGRTLEVIAEQLREEYGALTPEEQTGVDFAYEPVWAIGTGATPATPEQAEAIHRFIRARLARLRGVEWAAATRLLYGGNVNPGNVKQFLAQRHIDGVLVGGASLKEGDFAQIVRAGAVMAPPAAAETPAQPSAADTARSALAALPYLQQVEALGIADLIARQGLWGPAFDARSDEAISEAVARRNANLRRPAPIIIHSGAFTETSGEAPLELSRLRAQLAEVVGATPQEHRKMAYQFILAVEGARSSEDAAAVAHQLAQALPEASEGTVPWSEQEFAQVIGAEDLEALLREVPAARASLIGPEAWVRGVAERAAAEGRHVHAFAYRPPSSEAQTPSIGPLLRAALEIQAVSPKAFTQEVAPLRELREEGGVWWRGQTTTASITEAVTRYRARLRSERLKAGAA
jgi:triosephosphate isomerase